MERHERSSSSMTRCASSGRPSAGRKERASRFSASPIPSPRSASTPCSRPPGLAAARPPPRPAVSYRDLLDEIARFDVCIAPLEAQNPFCRAKSELKYVEAGAVGIPTVASDTPAFRTAIEDGLNGCLVRDPETWRQALRTLIEDAGERHRMGSEAQRHVAGCYGPEETRRSASLLRRWIRQDRGR